MYSPYLEFCDDKKLEPCWCYEYDLEKPEDQAKKLEEYELRKKRKDVANSAKKEDGERAENDRTFVTFNFDLEAVLYCPLFFAKLIFYKKKIKLQAREEQRKSPHVYQYL
ncbi:hypothetical protein ILUMI_16962 [Ignelater luminosus]|uniref:Uncharacterized protein n=1 Tax=Ignelater luminosus TaxID=2038154 RepID=A0A8K0CQA3_IGNLU|nr:hypothetical protein ILUMI_16962 [Ignelater luminosus]